MAAPTPRSSLVSLETLAPTCSFSSFGDFRVPPFQVSSEATLVPHDHVYEESNEKNPSSLRFDGGTTAWLQVFVSFLMAMNSFGYVSSFALFQTRWVSLLSQTPMNIAWVGSLSLFLLYFLGALSGPLIDGGYFRSTVALGCAFQVLGAFSTSAISQYWQLILAQGVVQGIGNGLLFTPCIALVSTYFMKRRGLALALTASGAPVGGVIFPIIARQLAPIIGFPWAIRVMGFILLFNSALILALARPRVSPRKGSVVDLSAFKDLTYTIFTIGIFFILWGLYVAYFYVSTYGKTVVGISDSDSLLLLIILNCGGIPGRIIPAYLADKYFGMYNSLMFFLVGTAAMLYGWIGVESRGAFFAFAVLYGICANAVQTLFPTLLTQMAAELSNVGARIGMCFAVASFACLTGAPIAGRLIGSAGGSYLYAQIFAASSICVGSAFLVLSQWFRRR